MIKARLWIFGVMLGAMVLMPTLSYANLLLNPGFESGLVNWTVSDGIVSATSDAKAVYEGSSAAGILFSGSLGQSFSVPDEPALFFSAYIRLYTNSLEGNSGLAQVTLNLPGGADPVVLGGPVDGVGFTFQKEESSGYWLSNWLLFEGTVDLSGIPGGSLASINISFVPGDAGGAMTFLFADNVVVQHTPLPWAVSLMGSGLLGLMALRKMLRF